MIIVPVNKKNIEAAYKTQIHKNLWENKEYKKDSEINREKMNKAIYVNQKFNDN